jgi:hypothetical protein
MDASIFEHSKDNQFLHLRDPEGELCYDGDDPVGLTLMSIDSPAYKKIASDIFTRLRKLKNPGLGTYEKLVIERLSRATVEVVNISLDGEKVESTPKKIAELYERCEGIKKQVFDYFEDESNFLERKPSA